MAKAIPREFSGRTVRRASEHPGIAAKPIGMDRLRKLLTLVLASSMLLPGGCGWHHDRKFDTIVPPGTYEQVATEIDYPSESACTQMNADESIASPQPWTIATQGTPQ